MLATGCTHLWDTKGAIARKAIGHATAADIDLLDATSRREVFWARIFLCLYVPGVLFTTWYFALLGLPALRKIIATSLHAVLSSGPLTVAGAAGAIALILAVASTGYVLRGLAQTLARNCRQVIAGRQITI